jgi:hypothetical protein
MDIKYISTYTRISSGNEIYERIVNAKGQLAWFRIWYVSYVKHYELVENHDELEEAWQSHCLATSIALG